MRSGRVRELPIDGYHASFKAEDGRRHDGPTAVIRKADARSWLSTATKRATSCNAEEPSPKLPGTCLKPLTYSRTHHRQEPT